MSFTQALYGVLFGSLVLAAGCAGPAVDDASGAGGDVAAAPPNEASGAGDEAAAPGEWPAAFADALARQGGPGQLGALASAPPLTESALRIGATCPEVAGPPLDSMMQPTPCETCHGLIAR